MFVINHAICNFHFIFIYMEIIWCNCTLYNVLTKTPRAFDKDVVIVTCYKVNSEHYASGFREYHHLNGCTQCYCHMIETLFYTVVCCAVCESRCVAFFYFLDDNVSTTYIQICILLACKACVWQVFCCCTRTNCYEWIFFVYFFTKFFISMTDSICQFFWHFFFANHAANFSTYFTQ